MPSRTSYSSGYRPTTTDSNQSRAHSCTEQNFTLVHPGALLTQYAELRPAVWDAVAEVLFGGDPGEAADKAIKNMTSQWSQ